MRNWIGEHINAILGTILAHLIIVFIALVLKINTSVVHSETPIIIDTELLAEMQNIPEENSSEVNDMVNVDEYLSKLTSASSNYSGMNRSANDNLHDSKNLSVDQIRQMYEEEILREKYGDDYESRYEESDYTYTTPYAIPDKYRAENTQGQQIDNTNKPCLVKAVLDDPTRATRYLHIPVFTCQGSGVIEIAIVISPEGKVINSKLLSTNTSNDQDCLVEAALTASRKSRFGIITSKQNQNGKIIYNFVNQ
ncbi:MAG: hypothetical protein KBB11_06845 [Bacteroidales bacterium]|nr:hypothetical protein [Bacteroidales bacterium]HOY38015.1 hypothetical protein [Bacteroidales bacterium]HQP04303.1 hypothetical protein [Bacteroidales bacterium]